jgi:hypothetical protein
LEAARYSLHAMQNVPQREALCLFGRAARAFSFRADTSMIVLTCVGDGT